MNIDKLRKESNHFHLDNRGHRLPIDFSSAYCTTCQRESLFMLLLDVAEAAKELLSYDPQDSPLAFGRASKQTRKALVALEADDE